MLLIASRRLAPRLISSTAARRHSSAMSFTFASPTKAFYQAESVKQVDVPTFSGSFGILANHVPLLAVLKPGVVSVFSEEGDKKDYFVSSGSVTVNEDSSVQVLAEEAVPVDHLDKRAAQEGLAEAQRLAASASDEISKAEAQVEVETFEAIIAAS